LVGILSIPGVIFPAPSIVLRISWAVITRNGIFLAIIASISNGISPALVVLVRSSLINRFFFLLVLLVYTPVGFCGLIKKKTTISASRLVLFYYLEYVLDICYRIEFVRLVFCFCFTDYIS
jgi:hypothetical protein